jgi:hypothetical protein
MGRRGARAGPSNTIIVKRASARGRIYPDLTRALHADRIHIRVFLVDEIHIDRPNVRVHRHMILGEIGIDVSTGSHVDVRLLEQRHSNSPNHTALNLTARAGKRRA